MEYVTKCVDIETNKPDDFSLGYFSIIISELTIFRSVLLCGIDWLTGSCLITSGNSELISLLLCQIILHMTSLTARVDVRFDLGYRNNRSSIIRRCKRGELHSIYHMKL